VRLRADKARWASNEIATFRVDVGNQGQREFYTFQSQKAGRLQVDGVWYQWTGGFNLKGSALPPGREYRDIPVSLAADWKATQEWRDKTKAPPPQIPLQVPPGKHTIRFAPEIRDITMRPKPQNNYVPSNPVEIEIEGNLKKTAESEGAAIVRAEDYHLVQTQIRDAAPGVPLTSLTVYVLPLPDHRVFVFKTFGSKPMEEGIKDLPRGSVLHYDGNALMAPPAPAQIQSLTAFCKSKGINLVLTPTS
jgi:hypothetical protein